MRHTTVLLTCAWLLFTPPLKFAEHKGKDIGIPEASEPLAKWRFEDAFGTFDQCEAYRLKMLKGFQGVQALIAAWGLGKCIPDTIIDFKVMREKGG